MFPFDSAPLCEGRHASIKVLCCTRCAGRAAIVFAGADGCVRAVERGRARIPSSRRSSVARLELRHAGCGCRCPHGKRIRTGAGFHASSRRHASSSRCPTWNDGGHAKDDGRHDGRGRAQGALPDLDGFAGVDRRKAHRSQAAVGGTHLRRLAALAGSAGTFVDRDRIG